MDWGEHSLESVPVEVAESINGDTVGCSKCGVIYKIRASPADIANVRMEIVELHKEEI